MDRFHMQRKFTGPIFIIGMPRSGTKLLLKLLNNHDLISIAPIETNFLHILNSKWHKFGDISNYNNFGIFYKFILQFPYFIYQSRSDGVISPKVWFEMCQNFSIGEVFESLIRHDTNVPSHSNIIWGDKSPAYITHMKLLHGIYPNAKFIHIIRDVRDYCLSINKAWNKNIFRAAQKWNDDVNKCIQDSKTIPFESYFEIKYEDLLENSKKILFNICNFLNIYFDPKMSMLLSPTENIGDAKGLSMILKTNIKKYQKHMSLKVQQKIESIAFNTLIRCNYDIQYSTRSKRVSNTKMNCYKVVDMLNLYNFQIKKRGMIGGYNILKTRLKFLNRL